MTEKEYRAHPAINQSRLKLALKSLRHYFDNEQREETDDMRIGTALHAKILQDGLPIIERSTKTGIKADAEILAAKEAGAISLHTDSIPVVGGMNWAILNNHSANRLLVDIPGESEKPIFWKHESGMECKALIDRLIVSPKSPNIIIPIDLKTTNDASPDGFLKACRDFHYPIQAAFYLQGLRANFPAYEIAPFTFVMIEKKPPYHIGIYQIEDSGLWVVENWINETLWKIALADPETAPGYVDPTKNAGIKEMYLPAYYLEKFNTN